LSLQIQLQSGEIRSQRKECGLYFIWKTTESLTASIYMEMGCYYGLELRFTNFSYRKQSIVLVLFSLKISPNFTYRTYIVSSS